MSFAVAVGVFGLVGVHPTEGRAEAAGFGPVAPVLDLPVPPKLLMTPETAEPATTTTVPVATTTTTAPPPVETTTTTAPPPPPPPTTAPPKPRPASSGRDAQAQVEAIADSTGWNWRAAGVRFAMGYHPSDCCHWGVYEAARSIIWIGPSAFGDQHRLRYVVLHELAHAWQYRQNRFREIIADYTRWGFTSIAPALEAGADCLATIWGARRGHYWNCPAEAQALAVRRLGGDWR
ncbi:MAG: hypothetical protein AB1679_20825 [Actinomycetota bacterium]